MPKSMVRFLVGVSIPFLLIIVVACAFLVIVHIRVNRRFSETEKMMQKEFRAGMRVGDVERILKARGIAFSCLRYDRNQHDVTLEDEHYASKGCLLSTSEIKDARFASGIFVQVEDVNQTLLFFPARLELWIGFDEKGYLKDHHLQVFYIAF